MFMREFRVLGPAASPPAASNLKAQDLELFGEPFVPEFLYEVIRNTKSFAHMRVGSAHIIPLFFITERS